MWWITLRVAAFVCIAALTVARNKRRRGSPEILPEASGQWQLEHTATMEAQRRGTAPPGFGGWPQGPMP